MSHLIVGLGNPGKEYAGTRHNAGRIVLDAFRRAQNFSEWEKRNELEAFSSRGEVAGDSVLLLLPETYMNNSGRAVKKALKGLSVDAEVTVVYDEIDMPLGALKISYDRGSGGHHGVDSLMEALGTRAFTRLRIGIAPVYEGVMRKPKGEEAVHSFLMKPFTPEERTVLEGVSTKANTGLELLIKEGRAAAMNAIN